MVVNLSVVKPLVNSRQTQNSIPAPQTDQSTARSGRVRRGQMDGARARTAASQGYVGGSRGVMGHCSFCLVLARCEAVGKARASEVAGR